MDGATLQLQGDLTLPRAIALRDEVLEALDVNERLVLDLSAMTDIDVSFLQILVAASRMATSERKTLTLKATDARLLEQAARCGIDPAFMPITS